MSERVPGGWKRRMKRELGWLMLAKVAALLILWALFFSPPHRPAVDGRMTADRLALVQATAEPVPHAGRCGESPCD